MSVPLHEFEFESEFESEFELEGEFEGEYEGELMIGRLLSGSGGGSPSNARGGFVQRWGRRLIPTLVRLLATNPMQSPALPPQPPPIVAQDERRRTGGAGTPPQREYEGEFEFEFEASPRARLSPPALMRRLAREAESAQSEDEAEAFVGALVPLAAQAAGRAAPALMRVAPRLISGLSQAASAMRRDPRTRPLVRQLPAVAQRTVASIAHRASQGRPVTPQTATRSLARQLMYQVGGGAERMSGGPQRPARPPRRGAGPFNIPPPRPPRPEEVRDNLRQASQQARRAGAHFGMATQILRDANLPYDPTQFE